MPIRATRLLVCHDCAVTLTEDDRLHYVYQCHACVVFEHELILRLASDPDHPDRDRLEAVPVEIGSASMEIGWPKAA